MLFQAVVIFLPILNFFKFHVKGESYLVHLSISENYELLDLRRIYLLVFLRFKYFNVEIVFNTNILGIRVRYNSGNLIWRHVVQTTLMQ